MEQCFGSLTCCWLNVVLLMAQLVASMCKVCMYASGGTVVIYVFVQCAVQRHICLLHVSVGMEEYMAIC